MTGITSSTMASGLLPVNFRKGVDDLEALEGTGALTGTSVDPLAQLLGSGVQIESPADRFFGA